MTDAIKDMAQSYHDHPDLVLEYSKGKCEYVLVLGLSEDGSLFAASNNMTNAQVLLMMERHRHCMMLDEGW